MMKKFFKQSIGILTGILLLGSVFAAVQQWNNSKLEISQKRMLFTDTGLPGGNCIMDINSGGNIIACTGIQDVLGNVYITGGALSGYITGYTETDPIWNATSGDYVIMSVTGDWNTAYSWVNTESGNALFFRNNSGNYVLMSMTGNRNTAYGRGDHAGLYVTLANSGDYYTLNPLGYITGYTETDPIYMANSGLYYLATNPSGYIDDSALHWDYVGTLLTPTHTGAIKVAIGDGASANGSESFAVGHNSDAIGDSSIAIGNQVSAQGYSSIAMGIVSDAIGNYSFAGGYNVISNGVYSNAFGLFTTSNGLASTSIGKYNVGLSSSIFEVGIGLSGGARYNALTITNTGVIKLDQLTGYACLATDVNGVIYDNSSSFVGWVDIDTGFNNTGSDTIIPSEKAVYDYVDLYRTWTKSGADIYYTGGDIYGRSLIAKGAGAGAIGINTVAIGNNAYASGSYSVAIGDNAGAFGYGSIAIGNANRSYEQYSTTLGYSNISNTIGGVSLGRFSLGITGALLEVGNGASLLARANAMTLLSSGVAGLWMSTPQHALDVSGAIQTNTAMYITGGTAPFRFALSGGLVEAQYYTGGNWTTAVTYLIP